MRLFRILHHFLVPHESNNHRAKALHHDALFAYVLLLAIFNLGVRFFHGQLPDVLGYATDIRVEALLSATNAKRIEAGLAPLTLNNTLSNAAAAKATDMFANNYWAHNSPSGKTPWDFIIASGYRYTLAGENLAKNFQTSSGVVDAWMMSPTHKANIVKEGYKDIGFAVVNGVLNGEETTLVVQMFGAINGASIAQIPKAEAAAAPKVVPSEVPQKNSNVTVLPTEPAAQVTTPAPEPSFINGLSFERVVNSPRIDMETATNTVVYVVVGILVGVLSIDMIIVSRKHIIRLAGHNIAHILFLGTIVVSGLAFTRGSLL